MLVSMHYCYALFDAMPTFFLMFVPVNVLKAVVVLMQMCMSGMRALLVMRVSDMRFLPGAIRDPDSEC